MAPCSLDCKNERPSRTFRRHFISVQIYVRRTTEINFVRDHYSAFRITVYFCIKPQKSKPTNYAVNVTEFYLQLSLASAR